jgi:hypothetical protein
MSTTEKQHGKKSNKKNKPATTAQATPEKNTSKL